MDDQQLEMAINHITDSGANSIRLMELCKRYADLQVAAKVWPKTLEDYRSVIDGLKSNPHISLGDLVYQVREREGEGWEGKWVKQWGEVCAKLETL